MSALRLAPERLAGPGGLVADLLAADEEALALFPAGSLGLTDVPPRADRLSASPLSAAAFHCQGGEARERLECALAGDGLVVTTGQQPQLFGGPLYVLYKAMTAIRVAAVLEKRWGIPCLAVFWVAGDDHDWQEVASIGFLDQDERLRRLELPTPVDGAGCSVGPSLLPAGVTELTHDFLNSLETEEAGRRWLDVLRDQYAPGRSFTEAFIGVASSWTNGLPIAFLDSAHAEVRRAAAPFIQRVLEQRERVDEALIRGTSAVSHRGYRPQLNQPPGAIPVFREGLEGRYRLRGTSGPIQLDRIGTSMDVAGVIAEIAAEPDRYSPSAALRPVLESWLLPVGATVLGPGEIAYWSQIGPLFELLGVPMPIVQPRDSWSVIERRIARLLEKTGVSADELGDGGTAATAGVVERSRPRSVEEALLKVEDRVEEAFGALEQAVAADLPGLRSAVGKSRSQSFAALASLRKSLDRMTRDREGATLGQLQRAAANLYPDGNPQERALAVWVYLARHGDEFLDAVRAASLDPSS